jgi:hypothetical protein
MTVPDNALVFDTGPLRHFAAEGSCGFSQQIDAYIFPKALSVNSTMLLTMYQPYARQLMLIGSTFTVQIPWDLRGNSLDITTDWP